MISREPVRTFRVKSNYVIGVVFTVEYTKEAVLLYSHTEKLSTAFTLMFVPYPSGARKMRAVLLV